jgi:hypothetical protein
MLNRLERLQGRVRRLNLLGVSWVSDPLSDSLNECSDWLRGLEGEELAAAAEEFGLTIDEMKRMKEDWTK